jgi:hypothetical protein
MSTKTIKTCDGCGKEMQSEALLRSPSPKPFSEALLRRGNGKEWALFITAFGCGMGGRTQYERDFCSPDCIRAFLDKKYPATPKP